MLNLKFELEREDRAAPAVMCAALRAVRAVRARMVSDEVTVPGIA